MKKQVAVNSQEGNGTIAIMKKVSLLEGEIKKQGEANGILEFNFRKRIGELEREIKKQGETNKILESTFKKLQSNIQTLNKCLNDQLSYSRGFYDGRQYIASKAEEILCKQTGCHTREELANSGKLPTFWIATLVSCIQDPPRVLNLSKSETKNGDKDDEEEYR